MNLTTTEQGKLDVIYARHDELFVDGSKAIPENLVLEILSNIDTKKDDKILVVFDVVLAARMCIIGCTNVTLMTETLSPSAQKVARYFGIKLYREGDMNFDLVIGNPPYQSSNDKGTNQPKSHSNWTKFSASAFDWVTEGGHVAFVTPDSWMGPRSKVLKLFKENNMVWVNTDVSGHFKVGSSFTAWIVQKDSNGGTVEVDGVDVDLKNLYYLPRNFSKTFPIHEKVITVDQKFDVLVDGTCHSDYKKDMLSTEQSTDFPYPTFHTNAQTRFSREKSEHFDNNKVVFTFSGYFKPFYDGGELGTSEAAGYILVEDQKEGESVLSLLNSKLYQFIANTGKWSGFTSIDVIRLLPKLENRVWTDAELYEHFGLTDKEIEYVETNI